MLKRTAQSVVALLLLLFLPASLALAKGGGNDKSKSSSKKDTVRAVVMYGDNYLFTKAEHLTDVHLNHVLDSLTCLDSIPHGLINEIKIYQRVKDKTEGQIIHMIDSLFELDTVPYALINEINLYVSTLPLRNANYNDYFLMPIDTSCYPANYYYKSWNTRRPFPYSGDLSVSDSTLMLLLQDSMQHCNYHHPLDGESKITSRFGWREGRNHNGIDMDLHVWDPVYSAFPGMVRMARYYEGYGRVVVVRHYNGLETLYAHLHRIKVKPGQIIEAGEVVGLGGSSGQSTGSHLHFEVRFKGVPIDPCHIISFKENRLIGDTLVLQKARRNYTVYPKGTIFHTVQRGDYLQKIADSYQVDIAKLCELNGMSRRTRLRVGRKVRVNSNY